jgi:hypothetical protein
MNNEIIVGDWKCAAPEYVRTTENGIQAVTYRFKIKQAPHDVVLYSKDINETTLRTDLSKLLTKDGEYHSYMSDFFQYILTDFAKLFVKKHTPATYVNALNHQFISIPEVSSPQAEYTIILNPVELVLKNGRFFFIWSTELPVIDVQIEDDVEPATEIVSNVPESNDIIEVNDIDESIDSSEIIAVRSGQPEILSDKQHRDRQRVEEARLRAKLAAVRAERALERYIQKYGDYETDMSSDDGETTDGGDTDF